MGGITREGERVLFRQLPAVISFPAFVVGGLTWRNEPDDWAGPALVALGVLLVLSSVVLIVRDRRRSRARQSSP